MMVLRAANDRGVANFGWLNSAHTFSFGQYYDPRHMGFSALRVINEDRVTPGAGFPTHGHDNMEIITYVIDGTISHKDSMGNVEHLPAGEFQIMSAGSGITHSEFNPSSDAGLHFLQIWIMPNARNGEPSYQQKRFERTSPIQAVITPDGRDGTLQILQNATLFHVRLNREDANHPLDEHRSYYVQAISGPLSVSAGEQRIVLQAGDGLAIRAERELRFSASAQGEAILFELP